MKEVLGSKSETQKDPKTVSLIALMIMLAIFIIQVISSNKARGSQTRKTHSKRNGGKKKILPKRRRKKVKVRKSIPVRKSSDKTQR